MEREPTGRGRRLIHSGVKFDLEMVEFEGAGGRRMEREVVRHPGAVIVLPILGDGRVVFVRNYRLSLEKELLELPAGTMGRPEAPGACAARELEEETGYRAGRLEALGSFYTSPGLSDELMHAYVGRELEWVGARPEEDERLTVVVLESAAALEMVHGGTLMDAKSMLVLLLAERRGIL